MADPAPFEDAVKDLVEQVQRAEPQVSDLISIVDGFTVQWVDLVLAGKRISSWCCLRDTLNCYVHHRDAPYSE